MATYTTFRVGGTTGTMNAVTNRVRGYQSMQFDVAKFVAQNAIVSGDIEVVLAIPAGTQINILGVRFDTALALGTSGTFSLGDSAAGTTFVNAASTLTAGTYPTIATASKTYAAADTLRVALANSGGSITTGTFSIIYEAIDLSASPVAQAAVSV